MSWSRGRYQSMQNQKLSRLICHWISYDVKDSSYDVITTKKWFLAIFCFRIITSLSHFMTSKFTWVDSDFNSLSIDIDNPALCTVFEILRKKGKHDFKILARKGKVLNNQGGATWCISIDREFKYESLFLLQSYDVIEKISDVTCYLNRLRF